MLYKRYVDLEIKSIPRTSVPEVPEEKSVYSQYLMQGWYYSIMYVKFILAINVFNRKTVEAFNRTNFAPQFPTFCPSKHAWRPLFKKKFSSWQYISICLSDKCIDYPTIGPICGGMVKYDICDPIACHIITFIEHILLDTTRITHKEGNIEFSWNDADFVQLSVRAANCLENLDCSTRKFSAWHCYHYHSLTI